MVIDPAPGAVRVDGMAMTCMAWLLVALRLGNSALCNVRVKDLR